MFSHGVIVEPQQSDRDPLAVALDCCRDMDRLPTLADLVEGIVTGLVGIPGVVGVAGLVDPDSVAYCGNSWHMRGANCALFGAGEQKVQWICVSPAWEKSAWKNLTLAASRLPVGGIGPLTQDNPDDSNAWAVAGQHWWADQVVLRQEPLLGLFMALERDITASQEQFSAEQLHLMTEVMAPVLMIWAESAKLGTRLRQVTAESRALGRINQLQGRFVAMASHEFKTPLTSITAYSDVLLHRVTDEHFPQATEFLSVIKQEADRLLRMINRILDFSRLEFGSRLLELKLRDLEPLVRETLRSLGPGIQDKQQTVTVQASRHLPKVEIDADLIRQVLVNLVGNAVKYTPAGGEIIVKLTEEASTVAVAVCDNGPGISAPDMKRIFNEFFRASQVQEGTGLGLSIARHIINLHGGHITVGPRATGGSEFKFMLPKAADLLAELPAYLSRHGESGQMQALVVNLMRLLAELMDSPITVLILRDGQGELLPVCALGLDPRLPVPAPWTETPPWSRILEDARPVSGGASLRGLTRDLNWLTTAAHTDLPMLLIPVERNDKSLGCIMLGRRQSMRKFQAQDKDQAAVLSTIVATALSNLEDSLDKTLGAIRVLTLMRRRGIPTATAAALQMVRGIASEMALSAREIDEIQLAAALHDAGMARLEEDILQEEGKLSWDQKDEIDRHIGHGLELMAPLVPNWQVENIIRHHHEWFDGSSYPEGLAGTAIPVGSRVLAVVDAWFSLTTDRPYRQGLAPEAALAEIESYSGKQFDPHVVAVFRQWLYADPGIDLDVSSGLNHEQYTQE